MPPTQFANVPAGATIASIEQRFSQRSAAQDRPQTDMQIPQRNQR